MKPDTRYRWETSVCIKIRKNDWFFSLSKKKLTSENCFSASIPDLLIFFLPKKDFLMNCKTEGPRLNRACNINDRDHTPTVNHTLLHSTQLCTVLKVSFLSKIRKFWLQNLLSELINFFFQILEEFSTGRKIINIPWAINAVSSAV